MMMMIIMIWWPARAPTSPREEIGVDLGSRKISQSWTNHQIWVSKIPKAETFTKFGDRRSQKLKHSPKSGSSATEAILSWGPLTSKARRQPASPLSLEQYAKHRRHRLCRATLLALHSPSLSSRLCQDLTTSGFLKLIMSRLRTSRIHFSYAWYHFAY